MKDDRISRNLIDYDATCSAKFDRKKHQYSLSNGEPSYSSEEKKLHIVPDAYLWLTTMIEAMYEARKQSNQGLRDLDWLFSESVEVTSFKWICYQINICPKRVRKLFLNQWNQQTAQRLKSASYLSLMEVAESKQRRESYRKTGK